MDRRTFLKMATAAAPLLVAGRALAVPEAGDTRLLILFLRGAYDAANIVAPTGNSFYHSARPTLALARPDPANPDAAIALDGDWSLHPALKDTMLPLWQKKQLAFVPFAGPDDLSRSHFETQDTIELGQPVGGRRDYRSGFMGRLADALGQGRPIAFTDQAPLIFRGSRAIPDISLKTVGKPIVDPRQAQLIEAMYKGHHLGGADLGEAVTEGFRVRDTVYKSVAEEMIAANRGAVSPKGFALSARRIGRLMRDQFNLAFVDVGGWDTHVNQGGAQGYLAGRIAELGNGLTGFVDEIGPDAWAKTVVVVVSEFGRTFHENGDRGTDHGHGSIYWVLGGGISGGRIAGPQVTLSEATLNQGRDLPVLTDYRSLIGGLLAPMYGLDAQRVQAVFPGVAKADLRLI
ncbi:MAG: hypothetical protein JWR77_1668 [Rhizorhabdus sp.]|nr:hypothetical protein [Rhizorhabdus sp.]